MAVLITDISGTLIHENSVVITGSGFGAKSPAAPAFWEDFEDYPDGGNPTDYGWINETNVCTQEAGTISDENLRHALSMRNLKIPLIGTSGCNYPLNIYAKQIIHSKKMYYDFWERFQFPDGGTDWQLKLFRPGFLDGGDTMGYPTLRYQIWYPGTDQYHGPTNCTEANGQWGYSPNPDELVWNHFQGEIDWGTQGNTDGYFYGYCNCKANSYGSWPLPYAFLTCINRPDLLSLGCSVSNVAGTITGWPTNYFDEVYFDNGWSRIEIGNAATYATCTHREIQIPSAWATGEITFTVNRGSFGIAEGPVYLYVVDSDGVVNANGYPIQFGQTYPATIPKLSGVRIVGGSVK